MVSNFNLANLSTNMFISIEIVPFIKFINDKKFNVVNLNKLTFSNLLNVFVE